MPTGVLNNVMHEDQKGRKKNTIWNSDDLEFVMYIGTYKAVKVKR